MDILVFLHKLGIAEENLRYYEGAFLLPAKMNPKTEEVLISVHVRQILPYEVYNELRSRAYAYLNRPVQVRIETNKGETDVNNLVSYINDFAAKYRIKGLDSAIPLIRNGVVYIKQDAIILEQLESI